MVINQNCASVSLMYQSVILLKKKYIINNDLVIIRIKDNTLTNNTDENYEYGNPYLIEIEKTGIWYELKSVRELNFTLPAFTLKPKESKEIYINWEYGYGELPTAISDDETMKLLTINDSA